MSHREGGREGGRLEGREETISPREGGREEVWKGGRKQYYTGREGGRKGEGEGEGDGDGEMQFFQKMAPTHEDKHSYLKCLLFEVHFGGSLLRGLLLLLLYFREHLLVVHDLFLELPSLQMITWLCYWLRHWLRDSCWHNEVPAPCLVLLCLYHGRSWLRLAWPSTTCRSSTGTWCSNIWGFFLYFWKASSKRCD